MKETKVVYISWEELDEIIVSHLKQKGYSVPDEGSVNIIITEDLDFDGIEFEVE